MKRFTVIKGTLFTFASLVLVGCTVATDVEPNTTTTTKTTMQEYHSGHESSAQPKCMELKSSQECMSETIVVKETTLSEAEKEPTLEEERKILISVIGQGVAPMNTSSPAQAYALAKRAAVADAYRLIAEKVKGVKVDGQDTIQNMMVKRSTVRTSVNAMIRNANIVETTFKEGLCEVEMEITITHSQFAQ